MFFLSVAIFLTAGSWGYACRGCDVGWSVELGWWKSLRSSTLRMFLGTIEGLFLRLDLAMAGRRAEGLPASAVGDRAAWRGAQRA